MSYFDTYVTSEQKFIVENNIKYCTRFRCFWLKSEKKKRDAFINSFYEQIEYTPQKVYEENVPVSYYITMHSSPIKINGANFYDVEMSLYINTGIFGIDICNCLTIITSIDEKTKDTFFGNSKNIILDSAVNGLMGKKVGQNGLHYMQCIPNIFKYTIHLISDDELNKHYLDVIMKNSESLDYVLKMI